MVDSLAMDELDATAKWAEAMAALSPEEQEACWRDAIFFGLAVIDLGDDGVARRVPPDTTPVQR